MGNLINNVIEKITTILRPDRMLHFFFGFLITYVSSFFLKIEYVFVVTLLLAILKEIRDSLQIGNRFDVIDILFTILPCALLYLRFFI